jgi:ATPase subunit of ABC transporter with duplicated ATPase domains
MMLEKPNVLVLDEPTNHLDIEGIEALIKALKAYKGTLILVSHDRHFVGQIVNRVVALSETGYKDYKGTYNQFLKYYGEDYLSQSFLAKK